MFAGPPGVRSSTRASTRASATARSDGFVATHCGDVPRIARSRCSPSRAAQPTPGCRLLHAFVTSTKYRQRVRCSRFPPIVARLRSCPDAPDSSARATAGNLVRSTGSVARSLFAVSAPTRIPPSGSASMSRNGRPVTSTSRSGAVTPSFIRSTMFVPPARNAAPACATVATAESAASAR